MYNAQVRAAETMKTEGSAFIIRPRQPLQIGRMENNPDKVQQVYEQGRADAKTAMARLRTWLAE